MAKQTILLTGATGFLGSHLLEGLLKSGYPVIILKRSTSNIWRIEHLMHQVKSYDVDKEPLGKAFQEQRIDSVIHTACNYGRNGDSISQIVQTNLMFSLSILDACLKFNTDKFFNTDTLLQKNLNIYSLSKKQFVEWLEHQSDKVQVVNLKLEHMYGPKEDKGKFVPWVISQLADNISEVKLTRGEQQRDFIYIDDVVSAYMTLLENTKNLADFSEFDVGTGELITVKSFLLQLRNSYEELLGKTQTEMFFGALPYRKGEMMTVDINNKPLLALNWKPRTSLSIGLKKTLEEYK